MQIRLLTFDCPNCGGENSLYIYKNIFETTNIDLVCRYCAFSKTITFHVNTLPGGVACTINYKYQQIQFKNANGNYTVRKFHGNYEKNRKELDRLHRLYPSMFAY